MIKTPLINVRRFFKSTAKNNNLIPFFLFSNKINLKYILNSPLCIHNNRFSFSSNKVDPQYQNLEKGEFTGPGFYVQQMMTSCLAIYSYYIESLNECFLIDPMN